MLKKEGEPVIHLGFNLLIAEIQKMLKHMHFEQDHRLNLFSTCVALPLIYIALFKKLSK